MLLSLVCTASLLCTGTLRDKLLDVAVVQWIGLSFDQINAKLGEKPIGFTVAGGTENPRLYCDYGRSRLIVAYRGDIAVKIWRNK